MDDIQGWIEELQQAEKLIVVEGKKDVAALNKLGITNVKSLNTQPIFAFADNLIENEIVILTDLDPAGRKLYHQLKKALVNRGKKVDSKFREFLFRETPLCEIEGLGAFINNTTSK